MAVWQTFSISHALDVRAKHGFYVLYGKYYSYVVIFIMEEINKSDNQLF